MTCHPDKHLPDCMMPDGGACCAGYREVVEDWHRQRQDWHRQRRKIERLEERCEAYKGQVKAGAAEIERLNKLITQMARGSDAEFARLTGIAFDMRAATIEECARIADKRMPGKDTARAIRALKEQS